MKRATESACSILRRHSGRERKRDSLLTPDMDISVLRGVQIGGEEKAGGECLDGYKNTKGGNDCQPYEIMCGLRTRARSRKYQGTEHM